MKKRYSLDHILNAKKVKFKVPFSWYSIISTWFYVGKLPAPGTCGSIAVYPLYYFIIMHSNSLNNIKSKLLLAIITFCIIGSFAIKKFQKTTNTYDHSYIVIDEVIGQLLTLYISLEWIYSLIKKIPFFINISTSTLVFLIALIPFRYFDIKKPLIIDYVNRKYKGTFGVIFDDILAAIFASVTIYVINLIVSLFI
ncbi:phosphatidylglycerophosphatase A [Candidatus Aquarickettsia rohweri]|uniref:Phosphatidylglycerophosphatase A n=1 Tax=Candidatus Aquarickettsia rohweri TaxID=2602574 RepID=A0A3R9ZKI1_9RICK|nr:phosphatidylglycerophosphatase A [Candidatus Aquarickettsia rohweri]MSO13622.1 Phosphatidylglycerophosphatase A [Rickettsiales endosymbiont of Trichoplax sp. H2]RST69953.1 phosphatidylglycerophosphatase A [Candidatus Aquarickettsia rohweri]